MPELSLIHIFACLDELGKLGVNNMLSHLPFMVLSREKVGMYALYMATLGNYPDLFAGKPHASQFLSLIHI